MTCRSAPGVAWSVDLHGVTLRRLDTGKTVLLGDADAALWDLISRQTARDRTVRVIQAVTGLGEEETNAWIRRTLETWLRDEWLERAG